MSTTAHTQAELQATEALRLVRESIAQGRAFLVEAGAGAGKTTSLIETVRHLIERRTDERWPGHKRVACITYTNVAKDEIIRRVDAHELVHCTTIHGFCWEAIKPFQAQLRKELPQIGRWHERLRDKPPIERQQVIYDFGSPTITEDRITLGHADVLKLMGALLPLPRFRALLADRYPFILIDEYQDSDRVLMHALVEHLVGTDSTTVLGFFGDHWQQIYPGTCGKLDAPNLTVIEKKANFRSAARVVSVLNRMRPELPQEAFRTELGEVAVYHTNDWPEERQEGGRWDGDLPPNAVEAALHMVRERLSAEPGEGKETPAKVLMLTHELLGTQQGYGDIVKAVRHNDALNTLSDPHLRFLVENVEAALSAYEAKRYGTMFDCLGQIVPPVSGAGEKARWREAMRVLVALRGSGTVGEVLAGMREQGRPWVPVQLKEREDDAETLTTAGEKLPSRLADLPALLEVPYAQIVAFTKFHAEMSPFATKHGVKGAEFSDVVVVATRGWATYNWNLMLELAGRPEASLSADDRGKLTRNRNLFYVACSRATARLTVLVTQHLSVEALETLFDWFGAEQVHALAPPTARSAWDLSVTS